MAPQEDRTPGKIIAAAVTAVAATYVYFLLFAQFGFLRAVQAGGGAPGIIKPVMGLMGLAGITGSVLAGRWFSSGGNQRLFGAGFAACAAGAGLTLAGGPVAIYFGAALLVGFGTGVTTVTLAGTLRPALGVRCLGSVIGLGTGLAYAFCNLPGIFNAQASAQAWLGVGAAGLGLAAVTQLKPRTTEIPPRGRDYAAAGTTAWVVIFLGLVCLDSAAFYFIQHTPRLKAATWGSGWQISINAGVHLLAAGLAGRALDRGWIGRTVLLGAGLLLVAGQLINGDSGPGAAGFLYAAGVSVYSTALVFYPANSLRPRLAALVYAVAGWGGSALGIILVEGRNVLPGALFGATGIMIAGALLVRQFASGPENNAPGP